MILCIFIALVAAAFADTSSPSPSSPHKCSHVDAAIESLQQSWDEEHGYTRPCGISSESCADGLIATWHSTFTSAGNARWNATRARLEFNNLMKGQWDNGFLPHVVFLDHFNASAHTRHSAASASVGRAGSLLLEQQSRPPYSNHSNNHSNHSNVPALKPVGSWVGLTPGPEWWDTNRATVRTSGIAAPPTQATVALQIYLYLWHEHPTGTTAHEFLYQAFIKVFNWHQYLHTRRDPDGNGMVYIRHPWESPLSWNASNVAATLQRANVTDLNKLAPNITVFPSSLIDLPGFPGNETYQKMLSIAACQSRLNWNEKKISTLSPVDLSSPCGFLVEDIAFNSLLLRADQDLNKIGMLLLQDKQEPEHNSDIINMQVTIQEWISAMESSTALGSPKIVRNLPKSDVSNGAVIISTDLSHPNASATDHFDVGALFPLMTANHISIGLANKLSTTALSPLFWTRYPLSESSFIEYQSSSNTKGEVVASKGGDERVSLPNNNCVRGGGNGNGNGNGGVNVNEVPIAIHVVGMLVEAWAMDVTGSAGLTLSVLANFMSSQAQTLFPGCPLVHPPVPFHDRYGSDSGHALPAVAEFGVVVSSPRAAAVAIVLANLTLPSDPPIPPVGLGMTLVIMWIELGFAFIVGISCIVLAVYHIRLISQQDQAEAEARANAYRHREESSYRGDSDAYGTGDESVDDESSSTKDNASDVLDFVESDTQNYSSSSRRKSSTSSLPEVSEWSWPLSYLFGGQTSTPGTPKTPRSIRKSLGGYAAPNYRDSSPRRGRRRDRSESPSAARRQQLLDDDSHSSDGFEPETDFT